jgi:hypothetical protein
LGALGGAAAMAAMGLLAVLVTGAGTGFFGAALAGALAAGLAGVAGFLVGAAGGFLAGALAATPLEAALGAVRTGVLATAFLAGACLVLVLAAGAFFEAVAAGFFTAFFDGALLFAGGLLTGLSSLRLYTREQGREFRARGL